MKKHDDFVDDGRTIADMSGVERPALFTFRRPPGKKNNADPPDAQSKKPWEEAGFTKQQHRAYITGAMLAALAIVGVFIVCGAIAILLMTVFWR